MPETSVSTSEPDAGGRRTFQAALRLVGGLVLICAGAIVSCCLLAACGLVIAYLQLGRDGLLDAFQEFRFNYRLKTLVGALVVASLYISITGAAVLAATTRHRAGWPARLALGRVRGAPLAIAIICGATLAYAIAATLTMALAQSHRVIISGQTDFVLLGVISTNLVLLAPVAEETLFRGWLYTGLRSFAGFWPSFLVTAAAFAAIHLGIGQRRMLLVVPLAVALGVLREVTGSIKPTIALHVVYNLVIVTITLLAI